jgi:nucleoside phosphorylase/CheY-like chemotaxis protein
MKILLIEDNLNKLNIVVELLRNIDGIVAEIEVAYDANQAKRYLEQIYFDVVILDISLPVMAGKSASPQGGLDLMEEILRRDKYKKPREIIGLTAHEDVFQSATPRFYSELWSLVHYDVSTDAWARQIERKIRYLHLMEKTDDVPNYKCDLCVLTALEKPEFSALLALPWSWKTLSEERDGTVYREGKFQGPNGIKRVIAACSPQMGLTAAAVLATKLIYTFIPRYITMVGIAAGIRGTCALGDIVCADPCWDWGSGKIATGSDGVSSFEPAPNQLRLSSFVKGRLTTVSQDQEIWDKIRREWSGGQGNEGILHMHIGPFASGAAVLSDSTTVTEIKNHHRKLIGIDMEAYGVFAAAYEAPLPRPEVFVLKSIVDFADSHKGDTHQAYAAYTSANALRAFAERYI